MGQNTAMYYGETSIPFCVNDNITTFFSPYHHNMSTSKPSFQHSRFIWIFVYLHVQMDIRVTETIFNEDYHPAKQRQCSKQDTKQDGLCVTVVSDKWWHLDFFFFFIFLTLKY